MPAQGAQLQRVSPIKPALRGARNWTTAQFRAASYSRRGFTRLVLSLVALIAFLVFIGLWMAGLLPTVRDGIGNAKQNTLMAMGFTVERVDVIGEGRVDEMAVRRAVGVWPGEYFFGFDAHAAQGRVESLPWVEHVVVRRLWPDRVVVQIVEKTPYALWQDGGEFRLVDVAGEVIADETHMANADVTALPHIVGADANLEMTALQTALDAAPTLNTMTASRIRVGTRWDILTHDNVRIQLPEGDVATAVQTVEALHARTRILDRRISTLDLRLSDRITVRPLEDGTA